MAFRTSSNQERDRDRRLTGFSRDLTPRVATAEANIAALLASVAALQAVDEPLAKLIGANFNSTADQAITGLPAKYVMRRIVVTNASVSLTTAAGGIYTAASKGGTVVVAAAQAYSALTAAGKFKDLTLEAVVGTDVLTATTLYLSLTTAQGAPATGDVYIFGDPLP